MSDAFFAQLLRGDVRFPDAAINYGGPLPTLPPGEPQFHTPDGRINATSSLLSGFSSAYAYGTSARISTQTQMAHPSRVALIIPKLYVPSPQSDAANLDDPVLEHTLSDGDLAFTFRMGADMTCYGSKYYEAPYGYASKAVPLLNLATVNYLLWGLQVGRRMPRSFRWKTFFAKLTRNAIHRYSTEEPLSLDVIWNFLLTYIRPFGVVHGHDTQGGQHEGDQGEPIVTHGAVDYVSSFAIEGKLLHVSNLWRDYDVHEGDDLVLALRQMEGPHSDIFFDLSSSVRSHRTERAPVPTSWYFLRPEVLENKSFSEVPYIHIARNRKYCSLYTRGLNACCWNARMCAVPGAPLEVTFQPCFIKSDDMFFAEEEEEDDKKAVEKEAENNQLPEAAHVPPPHTLPRDFGNVENKKKNKRVRISEDAVENYRQIMTS